MSRRAAKPDSDLAAKLRQLEQIVHAQGQELRELRLLVASFQDVREFLGLEAEKPPEPVRRIHPHLALEANADFSFIRSGDRTWRFGGHAQMRIVRALWRDSMQMGDGRSPAELRQAVGRTGVYFRVRRCFCRGRGRKHPALDDLIVQCKRNGRWQFAAENKRDDLPRTAYLTDRTDAQSAAEA